MALRTLKDSVLGRAYGEGLEIGDIALYFYDSDDEFGSSLFTFRKWMQSSFPSLLFPDSFKTRTSEYAFTLDEIDSRISDYESVRTGSAPPGNIIQH
jgi:hypothetical protein